MTDQELLAFIQRIRQMGGTDKQRVSSALCTLRQILERQHASPQRIHLLETLASSYEVTILMNNSTQLNSMDDLTGIMDRARRARQYDNAHRGCR